MSKIKYICSLSLALFLSACGGSRQTSNTQAAYGIDPAQMTANFCNDSPETVYIAASDPGDVNVVTRGWENVAAGACKNLSTFFYINPNTNLQIGHWAEIYVRFKDKPFEGLSGLSKIGNFICIPKNKPVDTRDWVYSWDFDTLYDGGNYSGRCPDDGERVAAYKLAWTNTSDWVHSVRVKGRVGSSVPDPTLNEYGFPSSSLLPIDLQKLMSEDAYLFYKNRGFADKDNPVVKARKELAKLPTTALNQQQLQLVTALRAWCWALVEFLRAASTLTQEQRNQELQALDRVSNGMPSLIQGIINAAGCTALSIAAGDASDLFEVAVGYDLCGEKLDWNDRMLSGLGLVVGSGAMWRGMAYAAEAGSDINKVANDMTRVSRQAERLGLSDPKDTKRVLEVLGECALKAAAVRPSWLDQLNRNLNPFYIPEAFAGDCNVEESLRAALLKITEFGFKNADEMIQFADELRKIPNFKVKNLLPLLEMARKGGFGEKSLAEVAAFVKKAHTNILPDMRKIGGKVIDEDQFMLRAVALSDDVNASGFLRLQEGVAAARYEGATGKSLRNSSSKTWDFEIEGSNERISLKGPLLSNDALPINPKPSERKKAVEGLANRTLEDVEKGEVEVVLLDLFGLAEDERKVAKDILKNVLTNKLLKILE